MSEIPIVKRTPTTDLRDALARATVREDRLRERGCHKGALKAVGRTRTLVSAELKRRGEL